MIRFLLTTVSAVILLLAPAAAPAQTIGFRTGIGFVHFPGYFDGGFTLAATGSVVRYGVLSSDFQLQYWIGGTGYHPEELSFSQLGMSIRLGAGVNTPLGTCSVNILRGYLYTLQDAMNPPGDPVLVHRTTAWHASIAGGISVEQQYSDHIYLIEDFQFQKVSDISQEWNQIFTVGLKYEL